MVSLRTLASLACIVLVCAVVTEAKHEKFEIRPGRDGKVVIEENDITCVFEFSAVGGTHEEWDAVIDRTGPKPICTFSRNRASYLQFMWVKAYFDPKVAVEVVHFRDNNADLPARQYVIAQDMITNSPDNWDGGIQVLAFQSA